MKGGAGSVEDVRGEYNAIAAMPGISYENAGHYGWHGPRDSTHEQSHAEEAEQGLERTKELLDAAAEADLESPLSLDGPPEDGMHMLVLDEILYAANRGLIDPERVVELVESKPENLELVLTGGHEKPEFVFEAADLASEVRKEKHPFDTGQDARKGTEY
jgi:cob(I)alamin adenosyltransferase